VLKAPDIPSALVELGCLSNRAEEKLLRNVAYQKKLAQTLVRSINAYSTRSRRPDFGLIGPRQRRSVYAWSASRRKSREPPTGTNIIRRPGGNLCDPSSPQRWRLVVASAGLGSERKLVLYTSQPDKIAAETMMGRIGFSGRRMMLVPVGGSRDFLRLADHAVNRSTLSRSDQAGNQAFAIWSK